METHSGRFPEVSENNLSIAETLASEKRFCDVRPMRKAQRLCVIINTNDHLDKKRHYC